MICRLAFAHWASFVGVIPVCQGCIFGCTQGSSSSPVQKMGQGKERADDILRKLKRMKTSSNKRDFQIFIFVRAPSKISLLKMPNAWKRRETIGNIESSWVLENSVDSNIWRKKTKTQTIWDRWGIWPVIGTLPQRRGHWLSSGELIAVTLKLITGCYKHCGRGRW